MMIPGVPPVAPTLAPAASQTADPVEGLFAALIPTAAPLPALLPEPASEPELAFDPEMDLAVLEVAPPLLDPVPVLPAEPDLPLALPEPVEPELADLPETPDLAAPVAPAALPAVAPVAALPLADVPRDAPEPALRIEPADLPEAPAPTPASPAVEAADPGPPDLRPVDAAPPRPADPPAREAAPARAEPAPEPRSALVRNVMDRLQEIEQTEGRTRVLLRPQGLGVLEIDVTRLADGRMQVALRAENPLVLQALQQDSAALTAFMGERGFDMSGGGADLGRYSRPETADGDASAAEDDPETPDDPGQLGGGQLDIVT